MPLIQVEDNHIIGTESIVESEYNDGSPIVLEAGQTPRPPSPEAAQLTIRLTSGSEIVLAGEQASKIWKQLQELTGK